MKSAAKVMLVTRVSRTRQKEIRCGLETNPRSNRMPKPKIQPALKPTHYPRVELIGGPLCGRRTSWGPSDLCAFDYYGGLASYRYEGGGKGIYICG